MKIRDYGVGGKSNFKKNFNSKKKYKEHVLMAVYGAPQYATRQTLWDDLTEIGSIVVRNGSS